MNTHLIMYVTAQEHARRSALTWHLPPGGGSRGRDAGRVWRRLRTRLQHSGVARRAFAGSATAAAGI